jgi:hypothetical protein
MFTILKRLTFVVMVPAVVGLGAWAQWTAFTAVVDASTADPSPADITHNGAQPYPNVADPKIKPARVVDRGARDSAHEQAQPEAEKINPEPAHASAAPPAPQVKPASNAERPSGENAPGETREAAEQQPPKQDDRSREREIRRTQNEPNARKANVAKREKADRAMQNQNSRSALAQAVIAELRKARSVEDFAARLEVLGRSNR